MNEIIVASNNNHKVEELKKIFSNVKLYSLKNLGIKIEIEENGKSFIENSLIKCKTIFNLVGKPVIADDSGLAVDQLNGAPGIFSARYGKPEFDDKMRYEYLLSNIDFTKPTDASFVCALSLYVTNGRIFTVQEEVRGKIINHPIGENGFGYDPVFFIPELNKTYAQLTDDEKNKISHRGKASKVMSKIICDIF